MATTLYRTLTGQSQKSHHSEHSTNTVQNTLTKTTTTDPLTGTLNHLTPAQEQRLDDFKEQLQQGGWWSPDGVNGKPTHDDGTLLRYLRARKFDINGAIGQFTDTEKWMKEQRVVELYDHFDVDFYERARLMYPQWTGHRDKRGIPIYVYQIKGLDGKNVGKYQKESQSYKDSLPYHKSLATPAKLIPLFALYQNLLNFVMPFVSTLERPNPEVPVTNSTNIVDISGVGLTQFWNLKGHMQDASVLATAHYPETLDRIFIIGAPAFFPTVWGWIKRWFDPVTVSKIFILGKHEVKSTLSKFIETKDFPKKYGGELEWDWGDLPHLDDETRTALEKDGNKGWVKGPALWLDNQRLVVGSVKGKLRRPDSDVEAKLPVVYAADYTEVPVHPDRKLSKGSSKHGKTNAAAEPHYQAEVEAEKAAPAGATQATIIADKTEPEDEKEQPSSEIKAPAAAETVSEEPPKPLDLEGKNLRAAVDGSAVHLPDFQPAHPAVTAEYVSSKNKTPVASTEAASAPTVNPLEPESTTSAPVTEPVAPAPVTPTTTSQTDSKPQQHPHPPSLPQSGPIPQHVLAMNQAVAQALSQESVSEIPATANGHSIPGGAHPEVLVASDPTKGLAIESEKIGRPPIERFVTAAEVKS